MATKIRYTPGIPRWFTRAVHIVNVLRCRRKGHRGVGAGPARYICVYCGQFLPPIDTMKDPNGYVDESERRLKAWLEDTR